MKLIGSNTEDIFESELKLSEQQLLDQNIDPRILELLKAEVGMIKSAYFLSGLNLPSYQNFCALINGNLVCKVAIADGEVESFQMLTISKYTRGLKRRDQIKLQVALELAAKRNMISD